MPEDQNTNNTDPNKKNLQEKDLQNYLMKINQEFKEKEVMTRAKSKKYPYINLSKFAINPDVMNIMSRSQAEEMRAMPFLQVGKKIKIAVTDPENKKVIDGVQKLKEKDYEITVHMASEESVKEAQKLYYTSHYIEKIDKKILIEDKDIKSYEEEVKDLGKLQEKIEKSSAEESLFLIEASAIRSNASDIHFQIQEKEGRVRFRIDGILTDVLQLSNNSYEKIIKQIKYLSHLKLNITNIPQDGKYAFKVNDRRIDVRVSTLPIENGETIVMRILDPHKGFLTFEELGFKDQALKWVETSIKMPNGLILVTGPTGSGKTTTLYSMLNALNTSDKKIITLEDPIEYHLKGITQSEVNSENNYTFQTGLRAILRQDPDVVMIGEIRDLETAETATQGALTGHIVLSTLHTNSACESIPRLLNIGLPPFLIAPALNIIIAQRLVRKLCTCTENRELSEIEIREIKNTIEPMKKKGIEMPDTPKELPSPIGCEKCSKTGYLGQISIVEVLDVDNDIKELIFKRTLSTEILKKAQEKGMLTMKEDGMLKVLQGITSLSEVWRMAR